MGLSRSQIRQLMIESIERNHIKNFRLAAMSGIQPIDQPILIIQGIELNALTYAVRLGRFEIVKFLIEEMSASVDAMRQTLEMLHRSPLDIICENGHLKLLKYMMPILEQPPEDSLFFRGSQNQEKVHFIPSTYTAIQRASERGQLEIVKFLRQYYKESKPPPDADVDYIDETSGENCALLACKSGRIELIQYLHEECKADFKRINKRREGVFQLAAVGSRKLPKVDFKKCFRYLSEVIGCDITQGYEETLLLLEQPELIEYVEKQLKLAGIGEATKHTTEQNYAGQPAPQAGALRDLELSSIVWVQVSQSSSEINFEPSNHSDVNLLE